MPRELALFVENPKIVISTARQFDLDYLRQMAEKYYRCGDFIMAERLCAKILQHVPDCATALNIRALMRFQKGDYPAALAIVEDILARNPNEYKAICTTGQCHLEQNRIEPATAAFNRAIALTPGRPDAHIGLGIVYSRTGQEALVQGCFAMAAQVAPDSEVAFACLGLLQLKHGDAEGAANAFLQAIENNDTIIENYTGLKRSVNALLRQRGINGNAADGAIDGLPVLRSGQRTYAFQKYLRYEDLVGADQTIIFSANDYKPALFQGIANYYADIPQQFPMFWNHKNVSIEYQQGQLYVQNQKGEIIPTVLSHLETHLLSAKCPYYFDHGEMGLIGSAPCKKAVADTSLIVMNFAGHFGHFMFDELPYLMYLRPLLASRNMKIVVPGISAIAKKFLDFLNFPSQCLVTWPELSGVDAQKPVSVMVDDAWFPIRLPLPLAVEIVRQAFHGQIPIPTELGRRKFYISRDGQRMINEHEIESALELEGFEIVHPEFMSVADQMRLFAEASIIVSGIGSGLASMIWSPSGTAIIEIMGDALPDGPIGRQRGPELMQHLKMLCRSLGHHFFRVTGKSIYKLGSSKLLDHVTCEIDGHWRDVHFTNVLFKCDSAEVLQAVAVAAQTQKFS